MMTERIILEKKQFQLTIDRLCYQLIENHTDFSQTALVGMQPRGIFLSRRIKSRLEELTGIKSILYGELDIAFYRDDFRRGNDLILPNELKIHFSMSNKKIVLIDDVLYTGRTIRAALDALTDFGRPDKVELLVLIDRLYSRQLPIQADYKGLTVDTRAHDKVKVQWKEQSKKDVVTILPVQDK